MGFKPFIAIGHGLGINGQFDAGCYYNGYCETEIAKEVVAGVLEVLDFNHKTYLTDYPDNNMNLIRSVEYANLSNCSHYISIHLTPENAESGIRFSYLTISDLELAEAIRASMKSRIKGLNDCGNFLKPEDYEISSSKMPSAVLEIGSIKADNKLITRNTRLFGHAIAYGLMDAVNESYSVIPDSYSVPLDPKAPDCWDVITYSGLNWEIGDIQQFLSFCDYGELVIDGLKGVNTKQALITAQRAYNITIDGVWGPITQAYAEAQVKHYQKQLNKLGYFCNINGIADDKTIEALEKFQKENKLKVNGMVDSYTYAKLFDKAEDK